MFDGLHNEVDASDVSPSVSSLMSLEMHIQMLSWTVLRYHNGHRRQAVVSMVQMEFRSYTEVWLVLHTFISELILHLFGCRFAEVC